MSRDYNTEKDDAERLEYFSEKNSLQKSQKVNNLPLDHEILVDAYIAGMKDATAGVASMERAVKYSEDMLGGIEDGWK